MGKSKNIKYFQFFYCYILLFLLLIPFFYIHPLIGEETSIIIEITSNIIESGTNFTVSVYDPSIQIGTPYLVNVTILFDGEFFQITPEHENSEITLTAPNVLINKTYNLQAFTSNKRGNCSITIIPSKTEESKQLVITTNSYSLKAYEEFSIIVTNKNGKPISNVSIYIDNALESEIITKTNEDGIAILTAPNKDKILLTAQKNGYTQTTEYLEVSLKKEPIIEAIYHPFTPVIMAALVLMFVILYVSIIKKFNEKIYPFRDKKNKINDKKQRNNQNILKMKHPTESPIENIHIQMQKQNKQKLNIEKHSQKNKTISYKWFDSSDKSYQNFIKVQKKRNTKIKYEDNFHKKIDKILSNNDNHIN